ncbi:MAG TPA: hypothetical protein VFS55_03580 [Dokdonella sp.]|nr:hypothetical protein [Dokdonella sp.]
MAAAVLACGSAGAQPVLTFAPLTPTTLTLPANGDAVVAYQVTNASAATRTFAMTPIPGIDIDTSSGHCADPFVLASHASCALSLHLVGSAMAGDIDGGPVVCIDGSPLQCWQPAAADQLHVTLLPAQVATIAATPTEVAIAIGSTATITIGNAADSPLPAQNLAVAVPPASSIVVDLGTCTAPLAPGASCTLVVGGTAAEAATVLEIAGDDTTSASVAVTLFDDVVFADGFDLAPG